MKITTSTAPRLLSELEFEVKVNGEQLAAIAGLLGIVVSWEHGPAHPTAGMYNACVRALKTHGHVPLEVQQISYGVQFVGWGKQ